MDESTVKAVLDWPQSHMVKELQHFLAFAKFDCHFIRNFSPITAPLTTMTKRITAHPNWSLSTLEALQHLKEQFTSAPILYHPDSMLPFTLEVDAANTGVGAILSQSHGLSRKLFPCAFFSYKLSSAECSYNVGDRELLAMKEAFEEW